MHRDGDLGFVHFFRPLLRELVFCLLGLQTVVLPARPRLRAASLAVATLMVEIGEAIRLRSVAAALHASFENLTRKLNIFIRTSLAKSEAMLCTCLVNEK